MSILNQKKVSIEIKNLAVYYSRNNTIAVEKLSLDVKPGEFLCLVGTTGCGKTTILNAIAGFIKPTFGEILVDGECVRKPSPDRGMVFQQHALFPWLTVMGNVMFGPLSCNLDRQESRKIAEKYIDLTGLNGFENAYPSELSGGMQQRVGLARTFANNPQILLMDEPFVSLDAQTRMIMQELLLGIWEKSNKTVVFVTHDVDEAILLADQIIVLTASPGRVKEKILVDLERPRKYQYVTTPQFIHIKEHALELIREETAKIMHT